MRVFCPSCWAENEPGADRCASCGAMLHDDLAEEGYADKLIRSLTSHPVIEARVRAAWILGNRREAKAVPILIEVLAGSSHEEFELKKAVISALGQIGDPRAVPALLKAAKDEALPVRVEAVRVLGEIGDGAVADALSAVIREDANEIVRREAEQAVRKLLRRALAKKG